MRLLLAPLLLAFANPVAAQMRETDPQGNVLPAGPNVANSGDFGIALISTTDMDGLLAEWAKPTPGISIKSQSVAHRNQPIFTFVVFGGCTTDAEGRCNVTAKVQILDPAGKPYGGEPPHDVVIWNAVPPPAPKIQLSRSAIGLRVEDGEALGRYTIVVTATDVVSGRSVSAQQPLTITEAETPRQ